MNVAAKVVSLTFPIVLLSCSLRKEDTSGVADIVLQGSTGMPNAASLKIAEAVSIPGIVYSEVTGNGAGRLATFQSGHLYDQVLNNRSTPDSPAEASCMLSMATDGQTLKGIYASKIFPTMTIPAGSMSLKLLDLTTEAHGIHQEASSDVAVSSAVTRFSAAVNYDASSGAVAGGYPISGFGSGGRLAVISCVGLTLDWYSIAQVIGTGVVVTVP